MVKLEISTAVSGVCGILAPLVAFLGIFFALMNFGAFSWQANALSDLGAIGQPTGVFFNSGLVAGGLLSAVFALGFWPILKNRAGKIGAAAFLLDSLALALVGLFPSGNRPLHFYFSVAFFVLLPIAVAAIGISLLQTGRKRLAGITFAFAAIAALVWIVHIAIFPFGSNDATPEMVAAVCAGIWAIVFGKAMVDSAGLASRSSDD